MKDRVLVNFGKRLRELRQKAGLSQEQFANVCHLDRTYVSGIERGVRNPTLMNVAKIARALKVTLPEMFEDVD